MLCREIFSNSRSGSYVSPGDYTAAFWEEVHRFLRYRHGRMQLANGPSNATPKDAVRFLMTCPGEQFLDFFEDIFQVNCSFHIAYSPDQAVEDLNALLRRDDLPYHLTGFVRQTAREVLRSGPFGGEEHEVTRIVELPKVIMRESEAVHSQATKPVLELLRRPEYNSANSEYLAALEDYRKDDFGDCLTKCGSAFESVLKIICHCKGWPCDQKDTAGPLVKTFLTHTKLEAYFESMLMTTAVLRNRLSASHGAGADYKQVSRHIALYALNVTASAILFVTQEVGKG
jgi:hypothetical protein